MNASSGNAHKSSDNMERLKRVSILLVAMILVTIAGSLANDWVQDRWMEKKRAMAYFNLEMKKLEAEIPETKVSSNEAKQKTTLLRSFNCNTVERQNAGFERNDVQSISLPDVQYRFSQGCAVIQVSTHVHSIAEGATYLIKEKGRDVGCGTFYGRNDSVKDCVNFLNERQGQELKLFVQAGLVIFN